MIKSLTEKK